MRTQMYLILGPEFFITMFYFPETYVSLDLRSLIQVIAKVVLGQHLLNG